MKRQGSVATLEDVAHRAGVHPSTVSRYFSNPVIVAAKTSARIEAAVEELGYIPNLLAGSLASSKRRLAALLIPGLAYSTFNVAIEEITSGLMAAGTNTMLGITGGSRERCDQLVIAALQWRVDAVIAWTPVSDVSAQLLRGSGVSVIEFNDTSSPFIDIGIGFNESKAGRAIARFVIEHGYARPYLVASSGPFSMRRRAAFRAEWFDISGQYPPEKVIDARANFEEGAAVFAEIRNLKELPDIIVCPTDSFAQALIMEASAIGLRVPQDMAIIGFGNTPMSAAMRPAMTTLDLHTRRVPAEVLRVLDARAAGKMVDGEHIDLGFTIVRRESA